MHACSCEQYPGLSRELLIQERHRSRFFVGRPAKHKDDDVLRSLCSGVLVAFDKGVARFSQSTLQKQVEGLAKVWGVLGVDIFNALTVSIIVSEDA